MSLFEDTLPASYRGVPFLVTSASIVGGIKNVKHSFVNSNKQNIENLGINPDSFSLEIVVTSDPDGEFYFQRRDNLLRILRQGIPGPFVHPFYGQLENIVATDFRGAETFAELGRGKFTVSFELSDTDGQPIAEEVTLPDTLNQANNVIPTITADVTGNFEVSSKYPSNFTAAVNKLENIVRAFGANANFLSVSAASIDQFSNDLDNFTDSINSLVNNPSALSNSVTNLFNSVNSLYDNADSTFNVLTQFFTFGEDDPTNPSNTVGRTEQNKNNDLLNGTMQSQSLVLAYSNASQLTLLTIEAIENVEEILEAQYKRIITNADLSVDTIGEITDLRTQVQQFFNVQKLTASQIVAINTQVIPVATLAFNYYGSTDLVQTLVDINQDLNTAFFAGDLEIVTND